MDLFSISLLIKKLSFLSEPLSFLIQAVGGPWAALVELFLAIVLPIGLGSWILGPISRRAGRLNGVVRFQLSDFFWLVAQFQFVLGYCVRFVGVEHQFMFLLTLIGGGLATTAMWAGAISFMSRAHVTEVVRRATFVMFVLPAVAAYLMATTFVLLVAADSTFGLFGSQYRDKLEDMLLIMSLTRGQLIASIVPLPAIAWLLRRIANWIVSLSPASCEPETIALRAGV